MVTQPAFKNNSASSNRSPVQGKIQNELQMFSAHGLIKRLQVCSIRRSKPGPKRLLHVGDNVRTENRQIHVNMDQCPVDQYLVSFNFSDTSGLPNKPGGRLKSSRVLHVVEVKPLWSGMRV